MQKLAPVQEDKAPQQNFKWGYAIYVVFLLFFIGVIASVFISFFSGVDVESLSGNVAIISIEGIITSSEEEGLSFESVAPSPEIIELIEKADENSNIKAIILEINSPGGSGVASEEIANAIKKTNKTTVAWIREIGTSGAYWVASAADYIVADRISITGSIGVIGSYLEFPGFLERYNVTYRRLVSGKYKDIGTPLREMTSEEQAIFQKILDDMRDYFVSEVAKNRQMSKKDVEKLANGLLYLGTQAKELGLVDELGSKDEVVRYIEGKEGITAEIVEYEKEKGLFEALTGVMSEQSFRLGEGIGSALFRKQADSGVKVTV